MRRIVAVVAGALIAVAASSCSSSPGTSTPTAQVGALTGKTPAQILGVATAAAKKAGSAHYVLSAVQGKADGCICRAAVEVVGEDPYLPSGPRPLRSRGAMNR